MSVVGSERLITKIYFPRLIIPISAVGAGLVDFLIACGMLGVLMACYRVAPSPAVVLAPLFVGGLLHRRGGDGFTACGTERGLSRFPLRDPVHGATLDVLHADHLHAIKPGGRFALEVLPAAQPRLWTDQQFSGLRAGGELDLYSLTVSLTVAVIFFVAGTLYFRRVERGFADII